MKKITITIATIAILFFVLDRTGGWLMQKCLNRTNTKTEVKIRNLVNQVDADILLMGTSRCAYHYVPSILMDSLHQSVYNGGIDASDNICSHYTLLNLILERYTPKVICLDLRVSDFKVSKHSPFTTITFFTPYIGRSASADSMYRRAGTYLNYQISHLYRYNSKAISIFGGLLVNHRYGEDHGYFKILGSQDTHMVLQKEERPSATDPLKLEYIQRFIDKCKQKGIRLVMVVSPRYSEVDSTFYEPLQEIAQQNGLPFLNYHSQGLFLNHPEYFQNDDHLQEDGARAFSSIFASDLKHILQK